MFRFALLLFSIMPLEAIAQDEESDFEPAPDRKYECHDVYFFADDPVPYIFVETFSVDPDEMFDAMLDELTDKELEEAEEIFEVYDVLAKIRFATVTISETEFGGVAYQAGLDYRIDFGNQFEFDDSYDDLEYALVIQADGDAAFYDFSDVESGEKVTADRQLDCERTQ